MRTSLVRRIISVFHTGHASRRVSTRHARVRAPQAGVTLVEMMIVVTLIALVAGLSYPSVASGLDTLRLRSASDAVVTLLNTSLDRAERRQQAVEIQIRAREGTLVARSADMGFVRHVQIPEPLRITDILPHIPTNGDEARRVLLYPGGAVPRIGIELSTPQGRKRTVTVDPITGVPQAQ
jgi:prepilin-type N-terminal cleavage/methylation domain-containing protein